MNALKKKESLLEKEVRKLKRDNQQLQREIKSLKETNTWLKWLVETYKRDIEKPNKNPYKSMDEKKPYIGKKSTCDHKFVDSDRCVKCGWIP